MNILITSGGRRADIVREFKRALGKNGKVCITDTVKHPAAHFFADGTFAVPRIGSARYIPALLDIVKKNKIGLLFSVIDTELPLLSKHRADFKKIGCLVMVSAPETIAICKDKNKTSAFLKRIGVKTPHILTLRSAKKFPVFIKPFDGSGSKDAYKAENKKDLQNLYNRIKNPLILEYLHGTEYSIDTLSDFEGGVLSAVPRTRELTMGGYAVRSTVTLDASLIRDARKIVSALKIIGPAVLQCMKTRKGNYFFEVNPRFGGGSLTGMRNVASAQAVVHMAQGKKPKLQKPKKIHMAAYLEHIFYDKSGRIRS